MCASTFCAGLRPIAPFARQRQQNRAEAGCRYPVKQRPYFYRFPNTSPLYQSPLDGKQQKKPFDIQKRDYSLWNKLFGANEEKLSQESPIESIIKRLRVEKNLNPIWFDRNALIELGRYIDENYKDSSDRRADYLTIIRSALSDENNIKTVLDMLPTAHGYLRNRDDISYQYVPSILRFIAVNYKKSLIEILHALKPTDKAPELFALFIADQQLYKNDPDFKKYVLSDPLIALNVAKYLGQKNIKNYDKADSELFMQMSRDFPLIKLAFADNKRRKELYQNYNPYTSLQLPQYNYKQNAAALMFSNLVKTVLSNNNNTVIPFMINNKIVNVRENYYPIDNINGLILSRATPQEVDRYLSYKPALSGDFLLTAPLELLKKLAQKGYELNSIKFNDRSLLFWLNRFANKDKTVEEKINFLRSIGADDELELDPEKKIKIAQEPDGRFKIIDMNGTATTVGQGFLDRYLQSDS